MVRGELIRLRAPRSARGREQQGIRLGVVVQADELAALSTLLVAPTSTRATAATFRPVIDVAGTPTRVLVEQTTAIDPSRAGDSAGRLSGSELRDVDSALQLVLGL